MEEIYKEIYKILYRRDLVDIQERLNKVSSIIADLNMEINEALNNMDIYKK